MMEENNHKKQKAPLIYAIVGVMTLIVAVAGSTYAFFAASVTNTTDVTGTAGGGEGPEMTITNHTKNEVGQTTPYGNLIPISMDATTLTAAANATVPCIDKNDYTACQIYSVTITNKANTAQAYNITLSSLTGEEDPDNTPNIEAVKMDSEDSVTVATSIKGVNNGICTTESIAAGGTSEPCYFMVFIKNQTEAQEDSGRFVGTVTALSTTATSADTGIVADFS